jgi:hypothetical protein
VIPRNKPTLAILSLLNLAVRSNLTNLSSKTTRTYGSRLSSILMELPLVSPSSTRTSLG